MRYVGVGRRLLATVVDWIVGFLWTVPFSHVEHTTVTVGNTVVHGTKYNLTGAPFLVSLLIWLAYYTLMEGLFGATVGKFATGIRVVREDGSKADIQAALVRTVSRFIDALPFFIPYLVGAIVIWTSPKRQRLGDRWAHTVVIRAGSTVPAPIGIGMQPPVAAPMPPPPPMPPTEG
jgi:uncharacterized RDD family membrane protein YckC